jgi:hypothetical protein
MKFDPEHLRIAAKVRAKAHRQSWFEGVGWLLFLLVTSLGLMWAIVPLAHMLLVAFGA